ncbi:MAG: TolC family protein [Verrucomicrobiota bacterium]
MPSVLRGRLAWLCLFAMTLLFSADVARAATNETETIDLATALKLAGAQNIDVAIAREKLAEAKANYESTLWQFFPWISPGFAYRAHEGRIQNVEGRIIDVHRDSYALGPTVIAQLELGEALYKKLAAQQLATAATHAFEAQRQEALNAAALAYFDLARAGAATEVARASIRIADEYSRQVDLAVETGIAFKGDALRTRTQLERNQLAFRQAQEQQRVAAARLAQILRIPSTTNLTAKADEFVPLILISTGASLDALVQRALAARPELRQSGAVISAATKASEGARYAPLVPAIGAQAFVGGLAGGNETSDRGLGESQDYQVLLGWRIGPGGLFDRSRIRAADARLRSAQLSGDKLADEIVRQVVDSYTRVHSATDQLAIVQRGLAAAEETFRLARERKEFGVGIVLETIQAEQELTRLRQDYVATVSDFNKAQFQLLKAIGEAFGPELRNGAPNLDSPAREQSKPRQ